MNVLLKSLYVFLILISCCMAEPIHSKLVYLTSPESIAAFEDLPGEGETLHLHLSGEDFESDWLPQVYSADAFSRASTITISDAAIYSTLLGTFLNKALRHGLLHLKLINLTRSSRFKSVEIDLSGDSLRSLFISGGDIPLKFFELLHSYKLPALRKLSLVRCGLTDKIFIPLQRSDLLTQVEYLDLSYNDLGIRVLNLFKAEVAANLQTLKLNHCFRFIQKKRLKVGSLLQERLSVNWTGNARMLQNLKHLEMVNMLPDSSACLTFYRDSLLQQLPVFEGPYYGVFEKNADISLFDWMPQTNTFWSPGAKWRWKFKSSEQELAEEFFEALKISAIIELEFYRLLFKLPSKSRRLSVTFNNLTVFNFFIHSARASQTENLSFNGAQWTNIALRLAIGDERLSALKSVALSGVNLTEAELFNLIRDFPTLHFSVSLYKNKNRYKAFIKPDVAYWPQMDAK